MFKRLAVGTASVLALAAAAAGPASAATPGPNFEAGETFSCLVPADDATWPVKVSVTTNGSGGVSQVAYALQPDHRASLAMPLGTGSVLAASFQEWDAAGTRVTNYNRTSVPSSARNECGVPLTGAVTIRAEVAYQVAPVRPTYGDIVEFCDDAVDDGTIDASAHLACVDDMSHTAGVK